MSNIFTEANYHKFTFSPELCGPTVGWFVTYVYHSVVSRNRALEKKDVLTQQNSSQMKGQFVFNCSTQNCDWGRISIIELSIVNKEGFSCSIMKDCD